LSRQEMGDDAKTLMYRPEFFGRPFLAYLHEVFRGPSFWTVGEREFMAMLTSTFNECPFCVQLHRETTRIEAHGEVDVSSPASARPELLAIATLLERVSRTPDDVTRAEVDDVRAAGVPDDAIVDALHVNLILNTMNRLANAFGWVWESDDQTRTGARAIGRFRYKLPGLVMR
jgi:uncharacterized peroxidase-related enzyme